MKTFFPIIFVAAVACMALSTETIPMDIQAKVDAIKAAIKADKNGQDREMVLPARVVTGPATLYMNWNDETITVNHPVSDQPIKAPDLADEFFEQLKVNLIIKTKAKNAQELLLTILSNAKLKSIELEAYNEK